MIGESYHYNEDFTELTIKIRPGVEWSDGVAFTARDIAFTLHMLRDNAPFLRWSADIEAWVKEAQVIDDLTVKIILNEPNPRFMAHYLMDGFVKALWIVPEHIWKDQDPVSFTNLDIAGGWPVGTGPYRLAQVTDTEFIYDLREDWWASEIGFKPLPRVERIIYRLAADETMLAMAIIKNEVDMTGDLPPALMMEVLEKNPKVSTFSYHEPPFGYIDWWPTYMGFNILEPPFDSAEMRWAISYAINPDDIEVYALEGYGKTSKVIFPEYPPLMEYYYDIADLLEEYPIGEFNLEKSADIMLGQGYVKDGEGFWVDPDGERISFVIASHLIFREIPAVVVANLRDAGFDAAFHKPVGVWEMFATGEARIYITGHAGSLRDPWGSLDLFHSRFVLPTGTLATSFYRWANPEFDRIVDEMAGVGFGDPRVFDLHRQAMEIWLPELPCIPLANWYHRNPINHTYWTGFPNVDDPYTNDAFWHKQALMPMLWRLEPAK
ncbi:Glutathione-binding protein GsiB [subsurface metagenome]